MKETIFIYVLPIAIVLFGIYLSVKTDILKDTSDADEKPYSFSRTQLMWWSLIIIACFTSYYGFHNEVIKINHSLLVLMGISLGTAATAKLIESNEISRGLERHQDLNYGNNFLINILSDKNGVSIHRFQAFVFNIIYGLIFIITYLSDYKFYEFGELELALLGISSAGYVGLKINENTSSKK